MSEYWIKRYDIPNVKHEGWAVIVIDSKGFLGIVSDFGNYSYHWSAFGDCFARFLSRLDHGYLQGKLDPHKVYLPHQVEEQAKALVLKTRRERNLTKEQAKEEWQLVGSTDFYSEVGYSEWVQDTSLKYPYEEIDAYGYPPCLKMFYDRSWSRFLELLRKDFDIPENPRH